MRSATAALALACPLLSGPRPARLSNAYVDANCEQSESHRADLHPGGLPVLHPIRRQCAQHGQPDRQHHHKLVHYSHHRTGKISDSAIRRSVEIKSANQVLALAPELGRDGSAQSGLRPFSSSSAPATKSAFSSTGPGGRGCSSVRAGRAAFAPRA